jgi:hypothetical protein
MPWPREPCSTTSRYVASISDADGEPQVADFGLARRLDDAFGLSSDEVSGTPSYMAPEQIEPARHRLSPATDVYGLGAIRAATSRAAWRPWPPGFLPAMLPGWGNVTPFAPGAAAQYRPDALAGLDITSPQYAHDYNEIKTDGAAAVRAANPGSDKSVIARFWYEASPSGWNRIARVVSDKQPMQAHEKARLYALVNIAIADGYIASWESKYDVMFWRPVTAIRRGGEDGRDDTVAETGWLPYLNTPQMPDFTSGHAVAGAAVAKTMAMFFGNDAIPFGVDSGAPFGGPASRVHQLLARRQGERRLARVCRHPFPHGLR